jgi:hypothetical protein
MEIPSMMRKQLLHMTKMHLSPTDIRSTPHPKIWISSLRSPGQTLALKAIKLPNSFVSRVGVGVGVSFGLRLLALSDLAGLALIVEFLALEAFIASAMRKKQPKKVINCINQHCNSAL